VRAPEDQRVHIGVAQRGQVFLGDCKHLIAGRDAVLNELDEPGAGLGEQAEVGGGGERVFVRPGVDGPARADHADPVVASRVDGTPDRGLDDLDHGDAVALPGISEHRGGSCVAGDHEQLDVLGNKVVHHVERKTANVGDSFRAIRRVRRVADVENGLIGQLVLDRPGYGESTNAGVEDSNRCIRHVKQA
jgi:hypothetical protein